MKRVSDQAFRELVAELLGRCPPPARTRVVCKRVSTAALGGDFADVSKARSTFTIRIARGLDDRQTLDALIHEYAHVMDWRPYHPLIHDHGPTWGVEYARIYCAVHGCT